MYDYRHHYSRDNPRAKIKPPSPRIPYEVLKEQKRKKQEEQLRKQREEILQHYQHDSFGIPYVSFLKHPHTFSERIETQEPKTSLV